MLRLKLIFGKFKYLSLIKFLILFAVNDVVIVKEFLFNCCGILYLLVMIEEKFILYINDFNFKNIEE